MSARLNADDTLYVAGAALETWRDMTDAYNDVADDDAFCLRRDRAATLDLIVALAANTGDAEATLAAALDAAGGHLAPLVAHGADRHHDLLTRYGITEAKP